MACQKIPGNGGNTFHISQLFSPKELMNKVKSLIASNKKLQSQIHNLQSKATKTDFRKPKQKPFDFSRYVFIFKFGIN